MSEANSTRIWNELLKGHIKESQISCAAPRSDFPLIRMAAYPLLYCIAPEPYKLGHDDAKRFPFLVIYDDERLQSFVRCVIRRNCFAWSGSGSHPPAPQIHNGISPIHL